MSILKKNQTVLLSRPCRGQELSLGSVIFINYIFIAGGTKLPPYIVYV